MKNFIFYTLVLYYLILNYFIYTEVERYSTQYFLLTIPIALFVLIFSAYLLRGYDRSTVVMAAFVLLVCAVSVLRLDYRTIISCGLFGATVIVIINSRVTLSIRVINSLFVLAILGSIVSYHAGINPFGYLPDKQAVSSHELNEYSIRVSLFPLTPESAFFSLFIVIVNYYFNKSASRYLFYAVGCYFLVFSASRTAIAVLAFFICFELLAKLFKFRARRFYFVLNVLFVFAFILMSNLKAFHLWLSKSDNLVVKAILLRTEQNITKSSDTRDVATRIWIWDQHFQIFAINPLAGVGTYEFSDYVTEKRIKVYHFTTGSESFLTSWLARVGISALLLIVFVAVVQKRALQTHDRFTYIMCLFFFLVMISYGSFVVPYNFMFLLMALSLNFSLTVLSPESGSGPED